MRRHLEAPALLKENHLAELVQKTCHGDNRAWAQLWLALAPCVETIAGRWRITGRLAKCPDERANIVVRFMGELHEDGFRRLAELGERLALRDGSYWPWLVRVASNSAITYVRRHPEYVGPSEEESGSWINHAPLPEALEDEGPDPSEEIEAHRILARAEDELTPQQLDALRRWLQGESLEEIAAALQLCGGAPAGKRILRSAMRRLRYAFAEESAAPGQRAA